MSLIIALIVLAGSMFWTLCHLPAECALGSGDDKKARLRQGLVLDIRGANQYCMAVIGLLGVIAGILASGNETLKSTLATLELWPFAAGFAAAILSILFIPAGYGTGSFNALRVIWVRSILCEQFAVVSTCYGVWQALCVLLQ